MANDSDTREVYLFLKEFELATSNKECTLSKLKYFQKKILSIIHSSNFGDFGNCFSKYCDYIMNIVSDEGINHKQQFVICEESFRILKDGIFGDKSLCTKFVKELIEKIFNIIIEEDPGIWIVKKEILKILNNCQQTLNKTERNEILQTLPTFYMFKLMDTLSTLSDYELQVHLLEAMFRIYGKKAINLRLKDIIPESEELSQIFGEINPESFDEDVRSFLNILNKSYNKIYSVLSCNIEMGDFVCQCPMDGIEGIWVDFNLSDRIISWSCIQETFMGENSENEVELPWVFISLMSSDVENFTITTSEVQQSILVSFMLKSSCICSNEEVRDQVEKIKNIRFLFKDSPQLQHIIADIFPLWFPNESTKRVNTMESDSEVNDRSENSHQIKIRKSAKKVGLNETGVLSGVVEPASVTTRSSNSLTDSRSKIQSTSHQTDQTEEVISLYSSMSSELSAVERDIESIKILSGRSAETSASFFQQNSRISSSRDVKVSRDADTTQEFHTAENEDTEAFDTARTVLSPHKNSERRLKDSVVKTSINMHSKSKISSKGVVPSENLKGISKEISNDVVKSSISISLNKVQELKQRGKKEEQLNMPIQSSLLVKNKVTEFGEKTQDILSPAVIVSSDDESEKVKYKRIVEPKISKNNEQQFVGVKSQKTDSVNQASIAVDRNQNKENSKINKPFEHFSQVIKSSTSIRNEHDTKNKGHSKYSFDKKKDNKEIGTVNKRFVSSTNEIIKDTSEQTKSNRRDPNSGELPARVIKSSGSTINRGEQIEEQLSSPVSSSRQINTKFAESQDLTPDFLTSPCIVLSDDESEKANCKRTVKPKVSKNIEQWFVGEEAQEPHKENTEDTNAVKPSSEIKCSVNKDNGSQEVGIVQESFVSSTNKIIEKTSADSKINEINQQKDKQEVEKISRKKEILDETKVQPLFQVSEKANCKRTVEPKVSKNIEQRFVGEEAQEPHKENIEDTNAEKPSSEIKCSVNKDNGSQEVGIVKESFVSSTNKVIKKTSGDSKINEVHQQKDKQEVEKISRKKEILDETKVQPLFQVSEKANCKRTVKPKVSKNIEQRFVGEEAQEPHKENIEHTNTEKPSSEIKCSVNKDNASQEVGIVKESFVSSSNKIIKKTSGDSKINEIHQQKDKQEVEKISRKKEILDETKTEQPNNKISYSDQSKRSHSRKEHCREISLGDSEKENQKEYLSLKSSTSRRIVKELEFEKFTIKKKKNVKRLIHERKRIIPIDDSSDDEIRKEEYHKILNISTLGNRKQLEPNFQEESSRESSYSADLNDINKDNNNQNKTKQFPESEFVKSGKTVEEGNQTHPSKTPDEITSDKISKIVIISDIKLKPKGRLGSKRVDESESSTEEPSSPNSLPYFVESKNTIQQHGEKEVEKQAGQVENNHNKLQKLLDGEETSDEEIFSTKNTFTRLQGKRLTTISEISHEERFEDESKKSIQPLKVEVKFKELTIPLPRCNLQKSKSFGQLPEKEITFSQDTVPITAEVSPDIFEDWNNENLNAKESQKSETVSQIEKEIKIFDKMSKQDKLLQDKTEINIFKNQEYDADSDNYTDDGDFPPNTETGPKPIINPETAFDELMKEHVSKTTINNQEHENQIIVTKETKLNQHQPRHTEKIPDKEIKEVSYVQISQKNEDQMISRDDQAWETKQNNYEHKKVTAKEIKEISYGEDVAKKTCKKPKTKSQFSQESEEQIIATDEIEEITDQALETMQKNYEHKNVTAKEIKEISYGKDVAKKTSKNTKTKSQISQECEEEIIARDEIEEIADQAVDTPKEIKEISYGKDVAKKTSKKTKTKSQVSQESEEQIIARDEIEEITHQALHTKQKNYEHKNVTAKEIKDISYGEDVAKQTCKKPKTKSQLCQESKEQIIARNEIEEITDQALDTPKEIKEISYGKDVAKNISKKTKTKSQISQESEEQIITRDEIEEITPQALDTKQKNYEQKNVTAKEIKKISYGKDVAKKTSKETKTKSQISQESEEQIIERNEIEDQVFEQKQKQCTTDALEYQRDEVKKRGTKTNIKDRIEETIIETLEDATKCQENHDIVVSQYVDKNGNKISQRTRVDPRQEFRENQIVVQALVHETSKHSKKVVTFDQTTTNEEQTTAGNDRLDLSKKPSELNQSSITTISNRSVKRKRILYDPKLPVDEFISNNTSIQNKSFKSSKHNKTVSSSSKFDEISIAEPTHENVKETESIFVQQTDEPDKEVESILSTQKQNEDEPIPSEIVNVDDSIEMRKPPRRNTNKNKNNSKPKRFLTEMIKKTEINKRNNIVRSSRFDNSQKKRTDLKSAFEDMLESFRSELGGRTLLEEMEIKKLQMSTSLFKSTKKEKNDKRKKTYQVTKRNCLVSLGTPTLSKRKEYDSESSDISIHGDSKKGKAKTLRKAKRISNKNMNETVENDFKTLKAANRTKRLFESTRFDEIDSNFIDVDEDALEPSPNKKRRLPDDVEHLGSFHVTVSDSAPAWHGMAVKFEKFVTIKSEEFLGQYLILFFYPLDFGFHPHVQGPKEILVFNEKIDEFKALNCEIVVCSVDSHYTHLHWIKNGKEKKSFKEMNVILLSDASHGISKSFGVYVPRWGHTLRSWFVINPKGIIRMQTVLDAPLEVNVDNVLEELKRLRKIEENLID